MIETIEEQVERFRPKTTPADILPKVSNPPYADVGFCLECSVQHARDVEHHLEDAVKFSQGDPNRELFQALLDRQRLVRKGVDKLRIQQIQATGGETCIACGNAIEAPLNPDRWPIGLRLPEPKKPYYVYWIKTDDIYVGPFGKREWATRVAHEGHEVVRRKRGWRPPYYSNPGNPEIPEYCEFTKEEVKPKEYFDPKSFRTLCPESPTRLCKDLPPELACATRIIIGCEEGKFVEGRCQVGPEAHVIYHGLPKTRPHTPSPGNPDPAQITSALERIRRLHTQAIPDDPGKSIDPRTGQQYDRFWLPEPLKRELIAEFKRPEGEKTGIAAVKYFNPAGVGTWWISEYDPERDEFFGIARIHVPEKGYISRRELRETRLTLGLWVERDYYWTPQTLETIMREEAAGSHGQRDEAARRKALLKYYEALPEAPPRLPPLKRKGSNPDELGRIDFLELLIDVLKDHEKNLDALIRRGSGAVDANTERLEALIARLEEVVKSVEEKGYPSLPHALAVVEEALRQAERR